MTERNGYYAEQNALALAHAITELKPNICDGFEFFGECIGKIPKWSQVGEEIEFSIDGRVFRVHSHDIKLDPLRETLQKIFYETYFKYQI